MHSLTSCPIPTPARLELAALGDFPITNNTSESLSLTAEHARLAFPADTLALEATASADFSEQRFIGYSERSADRLDFLLWPQGVPCELSRGDTYPGTLGGQAIGYAPASGVLLIAGSDAPLSSAVVGALAFDTRTGESVVLDRREVLSEPRAFATVSEFGSKLLIAGGEYPIHDASQPAAVLSHTAEVYDPATQRFEHDVVNLAVATTRHAAVLLESGETALIGGRVEASNASNFVQIVAPETRTSTLVGTLGVARSAPTVLRLDDGRLFIGGGDDASGHPVSELEWRSADAGALGAPFDGSIALPPRYGRAFAALPGGSVLAVGGCEDREAASGEDCKAWCQRGCPPTAQASRDGEAFWISAEGAVSALSFGMLGDVTLLPGSDGRPWLIAGATVDAGQPVPGRRTLYRFDPWRQTFSRDSNDLGIDQLEATFVSNGLDAFAWLTRDAQGTVLAGARLGSRSAYSNDGVLVALRDDEDRSRPAHLAPDRPSGDALGYDGALALTPVDGASAQPCVWLSDARFADFSAHVDFTSADPPTLGLGVQRFTDPAAADADPTCTLPVASTPSGGRLLIERRGSRLSLTLADAHRDCVMGTGRLSFGVCASKQGPARVTEIAVTRER